MLSDLIRSLSTRSLIALGINLRGGQLLISNRSLNRLLGVINRDLNRGGTLTTLSSFEISRTSTQNRLAILGHQLRIQVVLLTSNQALIGHSVNNSRTINNTRRTLSKLSLRLNRRRQSLPLVIRQSRLIRRHDTLCIEIAPFEVSVRANNRNK